MNVLVIRLPDDLTGYEQEPGDLVNSILGTVETFVGPDYQAWECDDADMHGARKIRFKLP